MDPSTTDFNVNVRAAMMQRTLDYVEDLNTMFAGMYAKAASDWTNMAMHDRELGIPLPAKPIPPDKWEATVDSNGFPGPRMTNDYVCPIVNDLPPVAGPPLGPVAHIGQSLGGNYYRSYSDDTCPADTTLDTAHPDPAIQIIPDPNFPLASGVYKKVAFFLGSGWWQKIG